MDLILASQSRYKQKQLTDLGLDFTSFAPQVQEDHSDNIDAEALAIRLAGQKAKDVLQHHKQAIVIGSDQTATDPSGNLLTKPGTQERAIRQLLACQGQSVTFFSAASIMSASTEYSWSVTTKVTFRPLSRAEIERYVVRDNPIDCAGSFKVEALGISLFERIESDDPTALIGLPLISLCRQLRHFGLAVP